MIKFIAEVSSNHYRDVDRAFAFIDVAASSGCGAVIFSWFNLL
jgi:sialic acid synthase SpsE